MSRGGLRVWRMRAIFAAPDEFDQVLHRRTPRSPSDSLYRPSLRLADVLVRVDFPRSRPHLTPLHHLGGDGVSSCFPSVDPRAFTLLEDDSMTHRVRAAFGRLLASGLAVAAALVLGAASLAAQQTTGKIEGSVTDQQGGPVANAQVTIVGTSFGALTNEEGYSFINNEPVGGTNSGSQGITVSTNALEEASVTTGALGVEFSDAQSGVISYTTKAGGEKISGSFSGETDEPFGNAISVGFNRFEGSLGGPVPSVKNLRWFGSAVVQGQASDFTGKDADTVARFTVAGIDAIVPDTTADGNVTQTVLQRFVQYSRQCWQPGSCATPTAQAVA